MIDRLLEGNIAGGKKSVLLLGPRQVGKSTLLNSLNPDLTFNLADEEVNLKFAANPGELRAQITPLLNKTKLLTVFIDEVQRIPSLLNTVQALLDENKSRLRFLLSGSSARKLRRGKANLLPGRIHTYHLGPVVSAECNYALDTDRALSLGTLPEILNETSAASAQKTLRSYSAIYVREEIQAEALSRDIPGFARFLKTVSSWSSELIDYSKIAALAMVNRQTVRRYFDILEDTLICHRLEPFSKSSRQRLIQHPKLYFFDPGVLNGMLGNFEVSDDRVGRLFETLIFAQLKASMSALDIEGRISFFMTERGAEVDFVVETGREVYIVEVKAATNISKVDLRPFDAFSAFCGKKHQRILFYRGTDTKEIKGIRILPWQKGLKEIGF